MKRFYKVFPYYILLIFSQIACQVLKKPSSSERAVKEGTNTTGAAAPAPQATQVSAVIIEPVGLTVGTNEVKVSELKQEIEKIKVYDSVSVEKALEQVIQDQRMVAEARKRGYDNSEEYKEELQTYNSILAEAYLTDSVTIKYLLKETYDWLLQEVRAAHIMYQLHEFANPADTAAIYNKLIDIRRRAVEGEDFGVLAQQFSQDKKTSTKGGELGWFSALQLVYPLEKAAFNVAVGQVSMPVRTKAGYHLVKVLERRPNSGKVWVQHILKVVPPNTNDSLNRAKSQIDSIYTALTKGAVFEVLCEQYSDDYRTKNNKGYLPVFGIGTREETAFEQAAFALKVGEFSKPVRTSAGWHIIRLAKKIPLESYEDILPKLKEKVVTDSRGELVKENAMSRMKKDMQFVEYPDIVKKAIESADTNLIKKKWGYTLNGPITNSTIFSIRNNEIKTKAFFDYVMERQLVERVPTGYSAVVWMRSFYKRFVDKNVKEYAEAHLTEINSDFRQLMQEYSTSFLKMQLMNDMVFEKSVADTSGQRAYYEKNKANYRMPERIMGSLIVAKDAKTLGQVRDIFKKGMPYPLNSTMRTPLYYDKYASDLTPEHKKVLATLLEIMRTNKGYIVEIGGHADQNENTNNSAERIEKVKSFLTANGLPIERIIENDYAKTKRADRFDWTKNQRVTFVFYSNSKKDVEKRFNRKEANSVDIEDGYFKRGDNKYVDAFKWETGSQSIIKDGKYIELIVERLEPARYKTLREARGQVLADYQKQLEKQLHQELEVRYPVKINKEEIDKALEAGKQ
ncbi:peptidylprolyl isomerase [Emticicia sp. BO119]|uniref:peptidylprolyl isomerase n=1 Tax=Emticicia sp. BO119 TaxID=2757768 RepID=UPI0015F072B1|nr:peptidylprolyl isomerase [Emticicia sp. BO119]MBA4854084.1 peptidylprolyl isomerase [Emticicia sp. BO119]